MIKWYMFVLAASILLVVYMFLQAISFRIRCHTLSETAGIRFLHFTDIHIRRLFISARRIKKAIEKTKPDYILFSGDFLDAPKDLKKLVKWLGDIDIQVPAYAVLGNHEHHCFCAHPSFKNIFLKAMKDLNIRVLNNDVITLHRNNGEKVTDNTGSAALIGIRDYKTGYLINNKIFTGLREQHRYVVAFSHNPDISLHIPENSVDILITGHLHGGQIWLPFNLEYLLLRKDKLSKMGYYKGFATIRKNRVYISRGLGTALFPFRFLSVPEVTVFDV